MRLLRHHCMGKFTHSLMGVGVQCAGTDPSQGFCLFCRMQTIEHKMRTHLVSNVWCMHGNKDGCRALLEVGSIAIKPSCGRKPLSLGRQGPMSDLNMLDMLTG